MQLGVLEAKTRFSELVDRAEKGEEIIITRRGAVVARLMPAKSTMSPQETAAWVERARRRQAKMAVSSWEDTKKLVHEGHKY